MDLVLKYATDDDLKDKQSFESYLKNFKNIQIKDEKIEDSNILAKYIIEEDLHLDQFSDEDFSYITDVQQICSWEIKWNFGDLISFSSYRDTWTYIIGKNGILHLNPGYDGGAGYLSIPYDVTKYLTDAKSKYKKVNFDHMDLRYDDKFIKDHIGIIDPSYEFKFRVCFYPDSDIEVILPNERSAYYDINFENQLKWMAFIDCKNKLRDDSYENIRKYLGVCIPQDFYNYYKQIYNSN